MTKEEAIQTIKTAIGEVEWDYPMDYAVAFEMAIEALKKTRRTGYWISLEECANEGVYCSVCNKKVWKADYAWCVSKNKLRSNYCPHCGAKMEGAVRP